jgi:hypothetical protein
VGARRRGIRRRFGDLEIKTLEILAEEVMKRRVHIRRRMYSGRPVIVKRR